MDGRTGLPAQSAWGLKKGEKLEGDLPEWKTSLVDRATYCRGRIITSFAQCEFLLADLAEKVDGRFVYLLKDRVKVARSLTEKSGPFNQYAEDLIPMAEKLLEWDDVRNFLVHGFMMFISDAAGRHLIEYRRYNRVSKEAYELTKWLVTVEDLERAKDHINALAIVMVETMKRIYVEQKLEEEVERYF
jgi:hypothetical protein